MSEKPPVLVSARYKPLLKYGRGFRHLIKRVIMWLSGISSRSYRASLSHVLYQSPGSPAASFSRPPPQPSPGSLPRLRLPVPPPPPSPGLRLSRPPGSFPRLRLSSSPAASFSRFLPQPMSPGSSRIRRTGARPPNPAGGTGNGRIWKSGGWRSVLKHTHVKL
jgi:hypothetical protein